IARNSAATKAGDDSSFHECTLKSWISRNDLELQHGRNFRRRRSAGRRDAQAVGKISFGKNLGALGNGVRSEMAIGVTKRNGLGWRRALGYTARFREAWFAR